MDANKYVDPNVNPDSLTPSEVLTDDNTGNSAETKAIEEERKRQAQEELEK